MGKIIIVPPDPAQDDGSDGVEFKLQNIKTATTKDGLPIEIRDDAIINVLTRGQIKDQIVQLQSQLDVLQAGIKAPPPKDPNPDAGAQTP